MHSLKGEEKEIYTLSNPEDLVQTESDPNYIPPETGDLHEVTNKPKRKFSAAYLDENVDKEHWIVVAPMEEIKTKYQEVLLSENFNDFIQYVKNDLKPRMRSAVVQILLEESSCSDERA
jgi:hypothetical protein